MWKKLQNILHGINDSKLLQGIAMLILNFGTKYVDIQFSKTQEEALRYALAREVLIFATAFMATRDLVMSLLLTGAFVIMADYLFNDQSNLCIMPERMQKIARLIDTNNDNKISPEEEQRALEILRKADIQKKQRKQAEFINLLQD